MTERSRRSRQAALAACAATIGLLTVPATTLAAGTVDFFDFGDGTALLSFTAGAGDVNDVVVGGTSAHVTIGDAVPITIPVPTPSCTGSGTTLVVCDATGISVGANLGDQADRLRVTGAVASTVSGGAGGDTLVGGPLRDQLTGDAGADTISGNDGDDVLDGGSGDLDGDTISGGAGADALTLGPTDGADVIDGGPGIDGVRASSPFFQPGIGFAYTLDDALADDGAQTQGANLVNIEDISSGEGSDVVRGTDGPNIITTVDGEDVVDGLSGADFVSVGTQDDTVEARDGFSDRILCGDGIDTVRVDQLDVLSDCENVTTTFVEPAGTPHAAPAAAAAAPPPPSPDAPLPAAARDTAAPACSAAVARTIRDPRRAIVLRETCDEPSVLHVTLTARLRGRVVASRAGDVTLAERTLATPRAGVRRLRLVIAGRLRAALGRRATLTLRVEATDVAGNRSAGSRTIRLVRRR
jgi:hypothetical protein